MKALITGATGFIGSAVLRQLLACGWEVRALVRPAADRRNVQQLPIEVAIGDLNDSASLQRACNGCEALFHVAADYRLWAKDSTELYRTNVEGTHNIMLAALQANMQRIVYTSSVATLGLPANGTPGNESTPATLGDMVSDYKRSKYLAEQAVRQMARDGAPVVIVNPSTPIGPRDVKPTPTGRMVLDAARGHMPAYVDTGLNIAHVDDVAAGHLLAYERGRAGERYVLGGEDLTLRQILTLVAECAQRRPPVVRLPLGLVMPFAYLSEAIALATGRTPQLTRDGLRMARKHMFFSSAKAQRELGYRSRPAQVAIADALQWFEEAGYWKRRRHLGRRTATG
jgi:dihydroflavonol-4-reductase